MPGLSGFKGYLRVKTMDCIKIWITSLHFLQFSKTEVTIDAADAIVLWYGVHPSFPRSELK